MILYFFDRYWKGLGKASSGLPKGVYYFDDQEVEDVETGTSTFEFFLGFDEETRDITKKYADETFYILAQDEQDETRIWQIIDDESDEEAMTRYFYCEDAGMDLINETLPAWDEPSSAQKAEYYIKKAVYDSGFEIGNNEIANLTRTLSWDGEASALARLQSILTQFDNAEFKFRFDIDESTLELRHKYIDLFKKVGSETGIQLRYGNQVKNIQVKRSKANLVNAYRCYGATPSGKDKPVTLDGYTLSDSQKEINAETGKARFVLSGNILKDTESNAKYSRYLNPNEQGQELGYYAGIYTGTAQTQKGLADEVIRKLKITGEPEINYIVELIDAPRTLGRGDYVFIINDYDEVYLEGRVLQVTRSRSNDTFEITLGDYLIKDSGINAKLQELADKIGSVKDGVSEFVWWAYADDELGNGFSLTAQNKAYTGLTKTSTDTQPTDPSVYTWSLSKGTDGTPGRGISGTPETTYAKSANGTTPPTTGWTATRPDVPAGLYLWTKVITKYTDSTESTTLIPTLMGPKGDPGAAGVGLKDKAVEYAKGTSGTVPPTSGWSETIPTVGANEYLWTRTTLTYTDNSTSVAYSIGKMGANGQDAQLLYLTATAENMVFNADDTPKTAQTITISAKLQNVTGTATFKAIPYIGNTAQSAITLGGSGNNRTLSSSQWTNKDWTLVAITATLGSLSDTLSIVKVKDGHPGDDGVSSYLHTAWKMADGTFLPAYPTHGLVTAEQIKTYTTSASQTLDKSQFDSKGLIKYSRTAVTNLGFYLNDLTGYPAATAYTQEFTLKITSGSATEFLIFNQFTDMPYFEIFINNVSVSKTVASSGAVQFTFENGVEYRFKIRFITGKMATVPQYPGLMLQVNKTKATAFALDMWDIAFYTDDREKTYPKYRGEYTDSIATDSANPDDYTWTEYLAQQGPPTGIVSQNTVPSSPYLGMLWDNTGEIAGYQINTTYRWDGTEWKVHLFSADNIRADTFIGFVFQGVEFIGSKFTTTWSTPWQETTININGTTNIEGGEYTNGYSGSGGGTSVTGSFVIDKIGNMSSTEVSVESTTQKTVTKGYELSNEGLVLTNVNQKSDTAFSGELSAQLLQRICEVGQVLWTTSGAGALMNATDVISPSIPLSECLNGWILEFRGYNPSGGGAQDSDYQYIHLPKHMVTYHSGKVFSPAMTGHGGTTIRKILYVTDTKITGHANNAISPSWLSCATRVFAY